jgi:hypothetical protein
MVEVESGIDLFAFEKLIPTLTDWFVTCHASVPAVCRRSVYHPPIPMQHDIPKDPA